MFHSENILALKQRALHIMCFDKCGCPPHSAGWATCQLAGFLRCPTCQHRLPMRPAEHGFYLPCFSRIGWLFHLASWPHKQTHTDWYSLAYVRIFQNFVQSAIAGTSSQCSGNESLNLIVTQEKNSRQGAGVFFKSGSCLQRFCS